MSHSQFQSTIFILRHAWLNLWDKRMTTGRINQVDQNKDAGCRGFLLATPIALKSSLLLLVHYQDTLWRCFVLLGCYFQFDLIWKWSCTCGAQVLTCKTFSHAPADANFAALASPLVALPLSAPAVSFVLNWFIVITTISSTWCEFWFLFCLFVLTSCRFNY